ncbi:hypothetical protein PCANC_27818, partial [Puccinia coronata f. sp. avenae]
MPRATVLIWASEITPAAQPDRKGITHKPECVHPDGRNSLQMRCTSSCEKCDRIIHNGQSHWQCFSCPTSSRATVEIPYCN